MRFTVTPAFRIKFGSSPLVLRLVCRRARAPWYYGCFVASLAYTCPHLMPAGSMKRKRKKYERSNDNVVCPGCARFFTLRQHLKNTWVRADGCCIRKEL